MMLREATPADGEAVADIDHAARLAALPNVRWAHPAADIRDYVARHIVPAGGVWLAEEAGLILGYLALAEDWVSQFYLRPGHWRRGIGSRLMAHAKILRPDGLRLYCFQCNMRARGFYQAHGFVPEIFGDGSLNQEREPDILYAWRGVGGGQ